MTEDLRLIELSIRHYEELLKLDRHTGETRRHLLELLAEAHAQLPAAAAACRNRQGPFSAI